MAVGSLQLQGELGTAAMATNNVYRDASHFSSEAIQTNLMTSLTSSSERHLVVGTLEHFRQNFRDDAYQDLDLDTSTLTLFGRFVTSKITNLRMLVIDEEDILGRDQSDQLNSFNSGLQRNKRYESIFEIDNSRYFTNIMWRYDQIDSRSFSKTATTVQDEALDRSERDNILLAGRHFGWGKAFLFGGTQAVRYESGSDPLLRQRNSDENRYGIGIEYQVGSFSGDADVYRFTQDFESASIPNIDATWVGSGSLNHAMSERLTLQLALERRFHETNIRNSGGIFSQNIFAGAAYSLRPGLYLRMGPSYNTAKIQNTPIKLERYELDVELGWNLGRNFKLLFSTNVFVQEPEDSRFVSFNAQQANSTLTISYAL